MTIKVHAHNLETAVITALEDAGIHAEDCMVIPDPRNRNFDVTGTYKVYLDGSADPNDDGFAFEYDILVSAAHVVAFDGKNYRVHLTPLAEIGRPVCETEQAAQLAA